MKIQFICALLLSIVCLPVSAQGFSCFNALQSPDSTVAPVNVGTVVTLTLETIDAIDVEIDGVSLSPAVDPGTNSANTWTATHTAVQDVTLVADVFPSGGGRNTSCSWVIDVPGPIVPPEAAPVPTLGLLGLLLLSALCGLLGVKRIRYRN